SRTETSCTEGPCTKGAHAEGLRAEGTGECKCKDGAARRPREGRPHSALRRTAAHGLYSTERSASQGTQSTTQRERGVSGREYAEIDAAQTSSRYGSDRPPNACRIKTDSTGRR